MDKISTVLEQSKKMKKSFIETENFVICFWKVFNSHLLVFRSSCDFLLSRHPKSLIYDNSRSNHKVYFTRYLLEVLCYLYSIKLVLQCCQFRMYYDLSEEFSFAIKVFNDEPNCWKYTFMAQEKMSTDQILKIFNAVFWPKRHMLKSSFLNLFWNLF